MSKHPLYPELTEQGKEEAQKIMDSFKPRILSLVEELMDELYCDVSYYIESDHWTNYRNALMDGIRGYGFGKPNHQWDYKEIRQAIYRNHKEEVVKDLNQDLVEENEKLKNELQELREELTRFS